MVLGKNSAREEILQYIPNAGYVGKDRIEYRVNVEGQPVKLIYFVHVTKQNLDNPDTPILCKANTWKISESNNVDLGVIAFASLQRSNELSAMLANASLALTSFTDLPGSQLAKPQENE